MLCYHAASDAWQHELAVPPATIVRQVQALLRRGYRPAPAGDVLDGRGRLLHVTFDDAYASIAQVLPSLAELGLPVTVFACPGYAEQGAPLAVPELAGEAKRLPEELRTMSWSQLRELAEGGVEIGSHTVTHPHLPQVTDDELRRELHDSRERIGSELGRACRVLAYPYGEHNARVRAAARAAGYEAAFALRSREWRFDRYALPRIDFYRSHGSTRTALKTVAAVRRPARWGARAVRRRRR